MCLNFVPFEPGGAFQLLSEGLFRNAACLVANHTLSLLSRITSFKAHKVGERIGVSAFANRHQLRRDLLGLESLKTGPGPLVYEEKSIPGAHPVAG